MILLKAARIAKAPNAGLASVGVFWGGFSALVPDLKAGIGASEAEFGLAMMVTAVGGIFAMFMAPAVMRRLGPLGLPVAGAFLAASAASPLIPSNPVEFGLTMILVGAAISLLDIGSSIRVSVLEERAGVHLMNFSHAMFSFGFAASAFVTSVARAAGYGPGAILPALAIVNALLILALREGATWNDAAPAPAGTVARNPWALIFLVAGILFASFVVENASETWSAYFIERDLGALPGSGGFGPVALGLTMGFGRLGGQIVTGRLGEARLVAWSGLIAATGAMVVALAPVPAVAVFGVGCIGVGAAVLVPSANSILGRLVRPDQRAHAMSRAWMVGFTGFFVGPAAIGLIAQHAGLRVAFGVVALLAMMVLPLVRALRRRGA
ncbi:MAG: MFS transporter [Rhodobacteraceae bacterium]|nr:MFS transporter [Paracoccaceae bacterium]